MPWMNFSAHVVDWDKPFLPETGYRSFGGLNAPQVPGLTSDIFTARIIEVHIGKHLKGRLRGVQINVDRPDTNDLFK